MKYRVWTESTTNLAGEEGGVGMFIEGEGMRSHFTWRIEQDSRESMIVTLQTMAQFLERQSEVEDHGPVNGQIVSDAGDTATNG